MTQAVWFIFIQGKQEGPYSVLELKRDLRITPDTLVWKEGFLHWVPIRQVLELKEVFADDSKPKQTDEEAQWFKLNEASLDQQKELALHLGRDLPPILFWILVGLIILSYIYYKSYGF